MVKDMSNIAIASDAATIASTIPGRQVSLRQINPCCQILSTFISTLDINRTMHNDTVLTKSARCEDTSKSKAFRMIPVKRLPSSERLTVPNANPESNELIHKIVNLTMSFDVTEMDEPYDVDMRRMPQQKHTTINTVATESA